MSEKLGLPILEHFVEKPHANGSQNGNGYLHDEADLVPYPLNGVAHRNGSSHHIVDELRITPQNSYNEFLSKAVISKIPTNKPLAPTSETIKSYARPAGRIDTLAYADVVNKYTDKVDYNVYLKRLMEQRGKIRGFSELEVSEDGKKEAQRALWRSYKHARNARKRIGSNVQPIPIFEGQVSLVQTTVEQPYVDNTRKNDQARDRNTDGGASVVADIDELARVEGVKEELEQLTEKEPAILERREGRFSLLEVANQVHLERIERVSEGKSFQESLVIVADSQATKLDPPSPARQAVDHLYVYVPYFREDNPTYLERIGNELRIIGNQIKELVREEYVVTVDEWQFRIQTLKERFGIFSRGVISVLVNPITSLFS